MVLWPRFLHLRPTACRRARPAQIICPGSILPTPRSCASSARFCPINWRRSVGWAISWLRKRSPRRDRGTIAIAHAAEITFRASEAYGYALAALRGAAGADVADLRRLAGAWRMGSPALAGVTFAAHGATGRQVETLGADLLIEELSGIAFQLHPTSFFQVNTTAAARLLELVRDGLDPRGHERLLDLYCGAGAFALPLAAAVSEVLGVEEYAGAVEDARATAAANGLANVRFEVGRVERALAQLDRGFEAVVLDPPRRGCHPQALAELLRLAPARIVYVACHPATLARDLKTLAAGGYRVARVQPVDLFPQTAHIESVTVLERG